MRKLAVIACVLLGACGSLTISDIITKINQGLVDGQKYFPLVCAAGAFADQAAKAALAKDAAGLADEQKAMDAFDKLCANPPADMNAAVQQAVAIYKQITAKAAGA